jgi:core-2/I-Branching enzyme
MKIAYLMLLHKDPVLFKRTVPILSSENCEFFVHIDRKSDIRQFSVINGYNIRFCEPRLPVYWSEFSQIEATMLLIQQALDCAVHYDYFVFLQGSTFPLRSGEYIESFLQENREWQFMNLVKMPAPGYPLSKINVLRYTSDKPVRRFAMRALAKLGLAERDYRRYLPKLDPYAGHACWAMSRDACQYVLEFAFSNPHVEAYFRDTFVPEESFFQTILGNSPFARRIRKLFVYADWPTPGAHPAMLDDKHLRFFEAHEKVWIDDEWGSGEMLFARKFSDDDLHLVERTEEMIRKKDY